MPDIWATLGIFCRLLPKIQAKTLKKNGKLKKWENSDSDFLNYFSPIRLCLGVLTSFVERVWANVCPTFPGARFPGFPGRPVPRRGPGETTVQRSAKHSKAMQSKATTNARQCNARQWKAMQSNGCQAKGRARGNAEQTNAMQNNAQQGNETN